MASVDAEAGAGAAAQTEVSRSRRRRPSSTVTVGRCVRTANPWERDDEARIRHTQSRQVDVIVSQHHRKSMKFFHCSSGGDGGGAWLCRSFTSQTSAHKPVCAGNIGAGLRTGTGTMKAESSQSRPEPAAESVDNNTGGASMLLIRRTTEGARNKQEPYDHQ